MKSIQTQIPSAIWKLLQQQLKYVEENSAFYQEKFQQLGVSINKLKAEDFTQLPTTTKEDLASRNEDFICVPKREIIDYVTTSGTLGAPVTFALNETDLQRLAANEEKSFQLAGVTPDDVVQITTTLDRRFIAGMAYFLGLRKLGAGLVRVGSGVPELQWDSINRFQPTYLVAVPSFLIKLGNYAKTNGIDCKNTSINAAICIGESLRDENFQLNALGKKIEELWGIELYSTYASTEMSTAFTECEAHEGNHILEELIYTEIVDSQGNLVNDGEVGELVVTTLGIETMPLIRYATGDLVKKIIKPCKCGREGARLSSVLGRKKQLIKYKGTSIYPPQITEALADWPGIDLHLVKVSISQVGTDHLEVILPDSFQQEKLAALKALLRAKLRVLPEISFWKTEKLQQTIFNPNHRKPIRFLDERMKADEV